ncbi:MAG: BTAD domain-containing putative transcriptional regulator [Gemmatimonadota bacterium]
MTIEFRLLGAVELRHLGGQEIRSVLAQPRRLALFAYLTLRSARGPERRDALLGVFWPESDEARARGALRNAIHYLRRALGAETILSRGDGELRVDLARVQCDAVEFERCLEAGREADALELYRGDLLEGFFIGEAFEFERWLEAERGRLCHRAVAVAGRLAAAAEADGNHDLAVHYVRRALVLSRDDEVVARRLLSLLVSAGDRTGAVRAYEEFAARVSAAYGVEPSPQTRAVVAEVKRSGPARAGARAGVGLRSRGDAATEPVAGAAVAGASVASRSPESGSTDGPVPTDGTASPGRRESEAGPPRAAARRSWRGLRRWAVMSGLSASALALLAIGLLVGRTESSSETWSEGVVAVFPFAYQGDEEFAFLREGMVGLLSANLDGAGALRSVDSRSLLGFLDGGSEPRWEPDAAAAVARRFGAGSFVLGEITEVGGRLRVRAALYGRDHFGLGGPTEAVVEASTADVFTLADRLAAQLLGLRSVTQVARRATRATENLNALKEFLRGEEALRAGRYEEAVREYQEAVREDSAFALAHYRLSSAAYAGGRSGIPVPAARAALRHADRLSRDDSLLVAAWRYHLAGVVDSAEEYYREAVTLRPSHAEAWEQLGELRFHWGPSLGHASLEAREALERAVALEPSRVEPIVHLARLAARERNVAELDSLTLLAHAYRATGRWALELEALRAFLSGDLARQERAIRAVAAAPVRARHVLASVASNTNNLEGAVRMARYVLAGELPRAERAKLQLLLGQLLLAQGRFREAGELLRRSGSLPRARVLEYRAMAAVLPLAPHSLESRDSLWGALDALERNRPLPPRSDPIWWQSAEFPPILWPGLYRPRRYYLEGLLSLRMGDARTARRLIDTLAVEEGPGSRLARRLAGVLRAEAARREGNPEKARVILDGLPLPPRASYEHLLDYPRGYERYLRGVVNQELGRATEAMRWYSTFPDPAGHDLPFLAPSHLRRAQILDVLGNGPQAATHYARFVELWTAAEPELESTVAAARHRLAELR